MLETLEIAQEILDALPVAVFWKDRNSVYLGCNKIHAAKGGITPQEVVGKTDYDLPWAQMAEKFIHDDQEIIKTQQKISCIEECIVNNERTMVKTVKLPLVEHDEVVGVLGFWQDISEIEKILDCLVDSLQKASIKTKEVGQKIYTKSGKLFESRQLENGKLFESRQLENGKIFKDRQEEDKAIFEKCVIAHHLEHLEDSKTLEDRQAEDEKTLEDRQAEDNKTFEKRQLER